MILAGPTHLWLAHGAPAHETAAETVVHSGCNGHNCSGHGHVGLTPEDEGPSGQTDSSPCDGHAGDCETCLALGAAKPIDLVEDVDIGDFQLIEIGDSLDESPWNARSLGLVFSRGPPHGA